eukprot:6241982-Prymnesium_polylepis.2
MEKIDWANVGIQIVRGCLTYQGVVMVGPWRFCNLWHLTCSRRECSAGHDLYGKRPTSPIQAHAKRPTSPIQEHIKRPHVPNTGVH